MSANPEVLNIVDHEDRELVSDKSGEWLYIMMTGVAHETNNNKLIYIKKLQARDDLER
jgi:hypothetical protein